MKQIQLKMAFALTCFVLFFSSMALGQRQIVGKVTDAETGEGLIGASVSVPGTTVGAATDLDGNYRITVPAGTTRMVFKYTGYTDQPVELGADNVVNVGLKTEATLDEVVVIGYGSVKKSDATGAVNAVSEKSFNRGAITSPQQLLAGKVAGVSITPNDGQPGGNSSIRIRGGTSVGASNEPLYVIDGVPIKNDGFDGGRNPLNFLNPSDIESITVLKDASAAAIYGSRGANGVIIITTKKGKKR